MLPGRLFDGINIVFLYFTKACYGKDIRTLGNKNAGAANTYKNAGLVWGILAGIFDGLKAIYPSLLDTTGLTCPLFLLD